MYDVRLEYFKNPLAPLMTQYVHVTRDLEHLIKHKRSLLKSVAYLDDMIKRSNSRCKDLQIQMFENADKIVKLTDAGTVRKRKQTTKETTSTVSPDNMEVFLNSLCKQDKEEFIANLMRQM